MKDNDENSKPNRREFISRGLWATSLFGMGAAAGVLPKTSGAQSSKPKTASPPVPSSSFDPLFKTDPKLVAYEESQPYPVDLKEIRALALGPEDHILVAGDKRIILVDSTGTRLSEHTAGQAVRCLAMPDAETIFAGCRDQVVTIQTRDGKVKAWESLGKQALLTSIAVRGQDVFVADAGNRCVVHYDLQGRLIRRLRKGEPFPEQKAFIVPSPYFDLLLDSSRRLWVVNPGQHRVESYNLDGQFLNSWGEPSYAISGFCGCCNPVHIAMLPDGRFVTSEKGIPRIKVYSSRGEFECVVAGAESFAAYIQNPNSSPLGVEIMADSKGRVLVGDVLARQVRVFAPKSMSAASTAAL